MMADDEVTDVYRSRLLEAVEDSAALEADWVTFHARLADTVAARLHGLRGSAGRRRRTAAPGDAWWDYAARIVVTAVPVGLAAALLLLTYLRSGSREVNGAAPAVPPPAVVAGAEDSARVAFESVLTGAAAPRAVMATLLPVRSAVYIAAADGNSR